MQETWVQALDQEGSLEEEMATHSSILSRKIPWTGEAIVQGVANSQARLSNWAHYAMYQLLKWIGLVPAPDGLQI